jgi:hypothetical protein
MAVLLIVLLLFGLVLGGFGGSSSTSLGSGHVKPVVKCSKRMNAKAPTTQDGRRCGPPPANP